MTKLAKLLVLVCIPAVILMGCSSTSKNNEYWDDTSNSERSNRMEKEMYKDK